MNREDRHLLFADNLPFVGYLVSDLCMRAANLSREDLATAGIAALISSSNSYSPAAGAPFGTFARRRITGALAESMRDPRRSAASAETRMTTTTAVREILAGQLGRIPTIDELAAALGAGRDAVQKALADASLVLEPISGSAAWSLIADAHSPEYFPLAAENRQLSNAAVRALPAAMRHIMEQIYLRDISVTSLAGELGTTPGIVAQKRSDAIRQLRGEPADDPADEPPSAVPLSAPGGVGRPEHHGTRGISDQLQPAPHKPRPVASGAAARVQRGTLPSLL